MTYTEAVKKVQGWSRVISPIITNEQHEELVIECGCVFMKIRKGKTGTGNDYYLSTPTVEDILREDYEVMNRE